MIITFYSYKGGVGRSMALANVANWLRLQGLRVAVIDWDLEAPGIECFFLQEEGDRTRVRRAPGLIDLVESYRQTHAELPMEFFRANRDPDTNTRDTQHAILDDKLPSLRAMLLEIAPQGQRSDATGGPLFLLGPGVRDGKNRYTYARDVQALDWGQFYEEYDGPAFFGWLRKRLETSFDVTLIDSRTGMTEVGGICTREMADLVVSLCAPNTQNLQGCALMVQSLFGDELLEARGGRKLDAMVIPARYDNAESDLLGDFERRFRETVNELRAECAGQFDGLDAEASWERRIAYTPKYAYQEKLCVGAPDANADLDEDYSRLASDLAARVLMQVSEERLKHLLASSETLSGLSERRPEEQRSLAERLEEAVAKLPKDVRAALPSLMLRFVNIPSLRDQDDTVLVRQELAEFDADETTMLRQLEEIGILSFEATASSDGRSANASTLIGRQHARLSSPKALEQWGRLQRWVQQEALFLIWRRELDDYAALSQRQPEAKPSLPEAFLAQSKEFKERLPLALSVSQRRFLERCLTQEPARPGNQYASPGEAPPTAAAPTAHGQQRASRRMPVVWGAIAVGVLALAWGWVGSQSQDITDGTDPPTATVATTESPLDTAAKTTLDKALRQERSGNLTEASGTYTQVLDLLEKADSPKLRAAALTGRGRTLWASKQWQSAYEDLSAALRLDPADVDARLFRARCGARLLTQAGTQTEDDAGAGKISPEEVLEDYDKALDESSEPGLYVERGSFQFQLGRSEAAIADFTRAITEANKRSQRIPDAHYQRGVVEQALGNEDAALQSYELAIREDPEHWWARYSLAMLTPNKERALEELRQTAENSPQSELRALAEKEYKSRAPAPPTPVEPAQQAVALNYSNPADRALVNGLRSKLKGRWTVYRPALVDLAVMRGSVRYFFDSDRDFAREVRMAVEKEVGREMKQLSFESAAFPAARLGVIEVWLPPLTTKTAPQKAAPPKKR